MPVSGDLIDDLLARGLVHDSTDLDHLRGRLAEGPVVLYSGFDPTADSLHLGHLVPLLLLRRFQLAGHRPIALAGGATGMVGDPSGRSEERNLLDEATLSANVAAVSAQLARFLDFREGPSAARLVDNRAWTEGVGVLDFLRDVGKHLTVNAMLARDSVRSRLESEAGISYTEFSYMLLQAFDFWWLREHEACELQVGGSDQWGNITAGIELVRKRSGHRVMGLTVPLVTRSDGAKFGKTAAGAVWLAPERTSPYDLSQYLLNVDDRDVERLLLQLTLLPIGEVAEVVAAHQRAPEQRGAQRRLADAVTRLVHGDEAASAAMGAAKGFGAAAASLDAGTLADLEGQLPTMEVTSAQLAVGLEVVDALAATLAASKGEARRKIAEGGVSVNDARLSEPRRLTPADLLEGRWIVLRLGKKRRAMVVVVDEPARDPAHEPG